MATGFEQARSVVAALAGDIEAADRVERYGPREEECDLEIENDEQDRDQVIADVELGARVAEGGDLVGGGAVGEEATVGVPVGELRRGYAVGDDDDQNAVLGILAVRLKPEGRGSREPINRQRVDAPENRRVTIVSVRA